MARSIAREWCDRVRSGELVPPRKLQGFLSGVTSEPSRTQAHRLSLQLIPTGSSFEAVSWQERSARKLNPHCRNVSAMLAGYPARQFHERPSAGSHGPGSDT